MLFVVLAGLSFAGLAWAMRSLPAGTTYAIWTRIGAALIAMIGMVWLGNVVSILKILSLVLLVSGVLGLNIAGASH